MFNINENSKAARRVEYFDKNNDFGIIILFEGATGFIMENGKTIDRIYV